MRDAAQWYRNTDAIAFRTLPCSISAHAEVLPRLRAQQRSGMIGIGIGGTLVQELQLNYRSLALAIAALSLLQITPAAAQAVYVAPGGVYVGGGPVYVIPAPPNGAPPFGPALGAAVVTGYEEYGEYEAYWAYGALRPVLRTWQESGPFEKMSRPE